MNKLKFGDIVLLKFPFTDGKNYKRRPALIINDFNDGDIIVCRITSQIYESPFDVYLNNWEKIGLKLPSVISVHKLATLQNDLVEATLGKIDDPTKARIIKVIKKLTD